MADVFKKQTVRYATPDGQRCSADTPGAIQAVEHSRKWYGTVNGKQVPLCRDKGASQKLLNKLLTDATLREPGVGDPYAEHRKRPLAEHLTDFRAALVAKGDDARHVKLTVANVRAVLDGTEAVWLADLDDGKVSEWLAALRADRQAVQLPAGQELFRLAEAARFLGVKPPSVTKAVRRPALDATGAGPARRYPRATVEALADRAARGASPETVNHYIRSLRAFGRWLMRSKRWAVNPFAVLDLLSTATDRRRDRRELTADELRRLLDVTRSSDRSFRSLTGPDRFHLYAAACGTGFRASALASLTPESFDLAGDTPTVTLAARKNKSRKLKVQPLPPDVAELLRAYLQGKPARKTIWGGTWARDYCGAEMLRGDLDAAGIPYAVEGPDGPRFADFHSLRHSYLTLGGRAGIDLRTLQELAGHSTPVLTARYSHRRLHDLAGAVEKLPNFLPADTTAGRLAATGTDGFIDAVQSLSKTRNDGPAPSAQPAQQQAHEKRTDTLEKQQIGPVGPVGKEREETRASHFSRLQEGDTMSLSTTAGVDIGCTLVAQTPCNQKHLTASGGTKAEVEEVTEKQRNPLNCQRVASPGISRHQTGELGFEGRQVAGHRQGVDSE